MISPVSSPEQMTDEQLEQMLTKRRLEKEQELLKDAALVDVVQTKDCQELLAQYSLSKWRLKE